MKPCSLIVRILVILASVLAAAGCDTTTGVRTQFVGSYAFTGVERRTISRIANQAARDARKSLPALPAQLTLRVDSGKKVIPEVGATATYMSPDSVSWTVDPESPGGVARVAEQHLRAALFHEFHHLVRDASNPPQSLMDHVVFEGLATAFERDFADTSPLWGSYSPDEASRWLTELMAQPSTANRDDWIARHADGRRWVGMRAGTYAVDLAMKRLNRTSADLVGASTGEIVNAALNR